MRFVLSAVIAATMCAQLGSAIVSAAQAGKVAASAAWVKVPQPETLTTQDGDTVQVMAAVRTQ